MKIDIKYASTQADKERHAKESFDKFAALKKKAAISADSLVLAPNAAMIAEWLEQAYCLGQCYALNSI